MGFSTPVFSVPVCFSYYVAFKDVVRKDSLDSVFVLSTDLPSRQYIVIHHEFGLTDDLGDETERICQGQIWKDSKPLRKWGFVLLKANWIWLVRKKPMHPCGR